MPELLHLPPWDIDYTFEHESPVNRSQLPGRVEQKRRSQKYLRTATAKRTLYRMQLPYFVYFIAEICFDGSIAFDDYVNDELGVRKAKVRIVNGAYSVTSNGFNHTITCTLEVP